MANNLVVNSFIANNGSDVVSVTKSGAGTVVLHANNTFTGSLTVAAGGTLILTGDNSARPNATTGSTVVAGGVLQLQANASNTSAGVSTVLFNEQTGTLQPFLLNNGGTLQLRSDSPVTFAGGNNFGGLGSAAVTIDVNGLTAAGANNTLIFAPGTFNVNTTTLHVTGGNGNRLATGTINNVAAGGVLTLNPTTAPLSITGYTANATFSTTLLLSGTAAGNVVTGVVANPATSGATSVTKTGSSTWELADANTHTGTTLVRQGVLTLSGNRTAASGAVTVADTAGLDATLNITNGNFSTGSTFVVSNQLNSGVVNQSGGSITFSGGTQLIVGNAAVGSVGTYNLSGGTLTGAAVANRGVILGTNGGTTGVFNLSGTGNLAMGLATVQLGRSDGANATTPITNASGIFNQSGGTAAVGTLTIGGGAGALYSGNSGTLNLTGGTFAANNFTLFGAADNGSASIIIGGTAQVTLPAFPTVRGLNATTSITFDGGTLSPASGSASYMGGLTNAFITANGAKFDVANGRDITVSQPLQNAAGQTGTLLKLGAGALTLTAASTYTGSTTVSAGSLIVNGSLADGAVTVASGAAFGGAGAVGGVVSTVSGSRIVPGGSAIGGTLTVGGLTLVSGAIVEFDLAPPTAISDFINVTTPGGLALNGGIFNLFNSGTLTPFATNGTYSLIDYAGSFSGSPSNISIGNAQAGKFYAVQNDAANTVITLTIADATVTEWRTGSGDWSTAGNWTAGVPNAPGAVARFGAIPVAPTTVAVNGAKTLGGIVFDNVNTYTVTGGPGDTITLSNGIATFGITVNTGSHLITAPLILATDSLISTEVGTVLRLGGNVSGARTLTAAGSGTTILSGTNTHGATEVTSGTLQIGDNGTVGTLGSGDVTIANGAMLVFNRSDSLTVTNNIGGATGRVIKRGAGTVTLTGANTFGVTGGGLDLNEGTVKLGSAAAVPSGVLLGFAGGTLDLNGNDVTSSFLSGDSGTIRDSGTTVGASRLIIDQVNPSTFGGSIADGLARAVSVIKRGAATLRLTGNNSFTGGLTITNGALIAAGPAGSIPLPANVTLGDGTNQVFLIIEASDPQFAPGSVLTFSNGTQNAKFELRGSSVTLGGIASSPTTTLSIIQNDEVGSPGYVSPPGLATLTLNTAGDHTFTGLIRNQAGGGLDLIKTGPGTQEVRNIAAQGHNFNNATISQGKLVFNLNTLPGGAAGHNVLGANVSLTVNSGGILGLDGTWNLTRPISGTGDVLKQGTGTVTISSANFHTGTTTLSQGILTAATVGGGALPGNVIMGTGVQDDIFLVMGAENQFGPSSVIDFNNGPGLDAKVELRGFNQTVAGLESDSDDTLSIVQNQESGTPAAATLTINAASDHVFHGIIRTQAGGELSLVKNGAGTQELRNVAAAGYTYGPATINAGKLVFNLHTLPGGVGGHDRLGGGVSITVNTGGALGLDGSWDMTAAVSGRGDLVKQGTETVTLSSFQVNHVGNTNVAAGTLLVTGSITGTSKVDVQRGATLSGNGFIAPATAPTGDINLLAGAKLSPGVAGAGALSATLSGGGEFDLSLAVESVNSKALLFELDTPFSSDLVTLTGGALNIGNGRLALDDFEFTPLSGFAPSTTYTLFDGSTPILGALDPAAANLRGAVGPFTGTLMLADGGNDLVLVVIPEPTISVTMLGGLGLLLARRRRS